METTSQVAVVADRTPVRAEVKLAEESLLNDEFLRQLINVGEVDILVGLPTYNNAKTIEPVVQSIQSGILKGFPRERAVIINADGGSRDGTPEMVIAAAIEDVRHVSNLYALRTLHAISTQYASSVGRGTALRIFLAAAELLRAKACAVISPESGKLNADWLSSLVQPIYRQEFDLVTPTYRRHKFAGLLMTNLLYPMTRALYGLQIREPYAPDFAFSSRLGTQFLAENQWNDEAGRTGSEINLTLAAITGGYRVCQSFLGARDSSDRPADLVPVLRQTVGTLFASLEPNFPFWSAQAGSQPVATFGANHDVALDPLRVNRKRLREMFCTGVSELHSLFQTILSPSTLAELQNVAALPEDEFRYPAELWVRTVYEFAASHHKAVISRDHIIQALAPLVRGRMLTSLLENRHASAEDFEHYVESLGLEFERLKPYLLAMWNTGK
jgi:glucosylglycerate synthase